MANKATKILKHRMGDNSTINDSKMLKKNQFTLISGHLKFICKN